MASDFPSIGKLLLEGFGEEPGSSVERSEFENGAVKQTQTVSRVLVSQAVTMCFTAAEYATFRAFWRNTLRRGADWFNWIDPRDGTVKLARIVGGKYSGQVFVESPGAPLSWQVSMQFEQWDDA